MLGDKTDDGKVTYQHTHVGVETNLLAVVFDVDVFHPDGLTLPHLLGASVLNGDAEGWQ